MRHLYLLFLLGFAITLFGFWPTTLGPLGPPDALRIVHGIFATLWMIMLVAQSWLIGRGLCRWHRTIGWSSLVVVPGLVISALLVMRDSLRPDTPFGPDLLLTLVWIDLWSLALFTLLYGLAIHYRRTLFLHARLMASTLFMAIIPALGRAYGMNIAAMGGLRGALDPSFWSVEAVLLLLIAWDGAHGRWRTPWWLTLGALLFIQHAMFAAPHWPAFSALVWKMAP